MGNLQQIQTAIFYFTGTGNSLSVARILQSKLDSCELIPIVKYMKSGNYDIPLKTVGLVFPMHRMGIPQLVHDFLSKAQFDNNCYIFAVVTGGKPKLGASIFQVKRLLQKQSKILHAGFHIATPITYFPLFSLKRYTPQKINEATLEKKLEAIYEHIQNRSVKVERSCSILHVINRLKSHKTRNASLHFTVDEGCIRCGYCVMVCPFQNIRLTGKKHEFLANCNTCFACVHYCSKGVIQYKNSTRGKQRYKHPEITIGDLAGQKR